MNFTNQEEVLSLLMKSIPKGRLVKILTEELNLTRPTVYKYIDNLVSISFDNMQRIMKLPVLQDYFEKTVSLRSLTNEVKWQYQRLDNNIVTPLSYLKTLDNYLSALEVEGTTIHISSYEVPLFYYLYYPRVLAFKLYCWSQTIWANDLYKNMAFEPNLILTDEILELITSLVDRFNAIDTVEYWTESLFDNTIRQINYFKKMDLIRNVSDCKDLANDLIGLKALMQDITEASKKVLSDRKSQGGSVDVYRNDLYFTNNIFVIDSMEIEMIFSAYDNPNYMITNDIKVFDRSIEWLKGMRSGCTSLTHTNDLVRKDFFDCLEFKLENLEI